METMAFTMASNSPAKGLSAAQILMQKHQEAHKPFIEEDIPKNTLISTSSIRESMVDDSKMFDVTNNPAKTLVKHNIQQTLENHSQTLDTKCDKLFPGLGAGAPKAVSAPVWGANRTGVEGLHSLDDQKSPPSSGASMPSRINPMSSSARSLPQSLAGQIQPPILTLQTKDVLPRNQLKKPIPDILRDINRKLRTNLVLMTGEGGVLEFRETSNQKESLKQLAIKELGTLVGAKVNPFL